MENLNDIAKSIGALIGFSFRSLMIGYVFIILSNHCSNNWNLPEVWYSYLAFGAVISFTIKGIKEFVIIMEKGEY